MRGYLIVIASTLLLATLSQRACIGDFYSQASKRARKFFLILIVIMLACFIGLRTSYNDTYTYRMMYETTPAFPEFWKTFSWTLGDNPGFQICNAIMRSLNISWNGMFLIYAFITTASAIWLFRTFSPDFTTALFLFFATNAYTLTAAAQKQCLAIAIAVFAIPYALKKRWVPFILIILLASTFHPYILMYLIVPLLTFKPWTKWTYVLIAGALLCGYLFDSLVGVLIDLAALVGDDYTEEKIVGEGIGVLRVLVSMAPIFLTYLYRRQLFKKSSKSSHVFVNFSTVNASVMFVGLFGSSIAFSRLAGYFTLMQCVSLPWILSELPPRDRSFWKIMMIVGYCGFFLYANVIAGAFDASFSRITLWEYVNQLLLS